MNFPCLPVTSTKCLVDASRRRIQDGGGQLDILTSRFILITLYVFSFQFFQTLNCPTPLHHQCSPQPPSAVPYNTGNQEKKIRVNSIIYLHETVR